MTTRLGVCALGLGLGVAVLAACSDRRAAASNDVNGADGQPAVRFVGVDMKPANTPEGTALSVEIDLEVRASMGLVAPHVNVIARCDGHMDKDVAFFSDLSHSSPGDRKIDVAVLFDHGELGAEPSNCEVTLGLSEGSTPPRRFTGYLKGLAAKRPRHPEVKFDKVSMQPGSTAFGPALVVEIELRVEGTMPSASPPHVDVIARCAGQAVKETAFESVLSGSSWGDTKVDLLTLFDTGQLTAPPTSCELTLSLSTPNGRPQRFCMKAGKTMPGQC